MAKARGLGRGLGALIPELENVENEGRMEIAVTDITPNPFQPRREFDQERLAELADSIREHGVIQPVLVRRQEGRYQLVAGERRLRAAEMVGLAKIPAVIGEFTDQTMMELALVENLQREDLNPIEEAEAYQRLLNEFSLTQEEIARKVGKSRSAIANTLRLLHLPASVRADLQAGRTTVGHARAILGLKDEDEQLTTWQEVVEGNLTVRQTEQLVRDRGEEIVSRETPRRSKDGKDSKDRYDPELKSVEDQIRQALGTKVRIQPVGAGGRIEITYFSSEELNRILEVIMQ